jgi:UDP-N-acetylglucosamine--N-acetylmuramyl-(pentapeptide) pyrophosphoryl-undecaprenol N-acetylglucosamine transferase
MREALFEPSKKSPYVLDIKKYPLLYITGGGTGAQSLNDLIFPIIPELLKKYSVIHQVGEVSLAAAQKIQSDRYIAVQYIPLPEVSWILAHSSLVISRSGANTITELAALGKVAVLVPLPWSGGGEQQKNAEWLGSHGGAVVANQQALSSEMLYTTIQDIWKNFTEFQQKASGFAPRIPRDGTKKFLNEIEKILHEH